jgi:hypothetical protein
MNRSKNICGLFAIALILAAMPGFSQSFNVIKVDTSVSEVTGNGFFYNLGQTQLEIEVSVTKVEKIKGPYSEFAGKYLGLSNVINQNSTQYELNGITIRSMTLPDPSQYYFVELGKKSSKDASDLVMVLSESGLLLNTDGTEQTYSPEENFTPAAEESNIYPDVFKYFSDLNLFEQVDTIIERINIDTATIEKMVLKRTLVEKSPEQKAKDAADFIMKVKENRLNLISGYQEVNYDKETFTLMNQELEKLETEYQKLFTGLTFTKTLSYRFTYTPDAAKPSDSVPLFRFSDLLGILDTSNVNGKLVYLSLRRTESTKPVQNFLSKKDESKVRSRGYFYRVPEYADVAVNMSGRSKISYRFLINQFGVINYLPAKQTKLRLFPSTSGLQKIEIGE